MLEVQDLYVSYGMMEVLHGVDISVQDGELISVIGPNGAGKTTLIKTIMGLVKPKSGKILFRHCRGCRNAAHAFSDQRGRVRHDSDNAFCPGQGFQTCNRRAGYNGNNQTIADLLPERVYRFRQILRLDGKHHCVGVRQRFLKTSGALQREALSPGPVDVVDFKIPLAGGLKRPGYRTAHVAATYYGNSHKSSRLAPSLAKLRALEKIFPHGHPG